MDDIEPGDRMKKRRDLLVLLGTGMASAPIELFGQQPAKINRIGFLQIGPPTIRWQFDAFMQQLRELGYVEGKTVTIEYRSAESKYELLPGLAAELVQRNVHVIVAADGTPAALAAKNATRTIPVVFVNVADPVGQGMVQSLARPGGNVTGLSSLHSETAMKTLQLLKEIVPSATRVAILTNPENSSLPFVIKEMEVAARRLSLATSLVHAGSPGDFENAVAEAIRLRASGIAVLTDAMFNTNAASLAALVTQRRMPTIGGVDLYAESGGLLSYGANRIENYRRAAVLVDKILKGTKISDLPVEQPTKFSLIVNLKTARELGLTIPQTILVWADKVIQ